MIVLLFCSLSFYCKKKPEIEIIDPTLYEFLFYSGFYQKDQVVVTFKNHDTFRYTFEDRIIRELTVKDIFKKKLKDDPKAVDKSEFFEATITATNEQDKSIVLVNFGKDKDYKIKINPTTTIPFEFQHKGEVLNLLNDVSNFQILNYAIFRGKEQLQKIADQSANNILSGVNSNLLLLNYLRDKSFENLPDRSVNLTEQDSFKERLFTILDRLVLATVKKLNFEVGRVRSEYNVAYADTFLTTQKSKICLDNSLFIASILSRYFEYEPVLFYIKTKDTFHVFTGVTKSAHYAVGETATIFLLESNQGEAKNTIKLLRDSDFERLFKIEFNDFKKCPDSNKDWYTECQFIGKMNVELPKDGVILKTNDDRIGLLSFYGLGNSSFLSAPEEGFSSNENYDAISNYRKTYVRLADSNPQNYQRDEIIFNENINKPISITYNTKLECIHPIISSNNIIFLKNPAEEQKNCMQETQLTLTPTDEKTTNNIFHFSIKAWDKKIPIFPMKDSQGIKAQNTFIKKYEMIIDAGANFYFQKYSACLMYGKLAHSRTDMEERFQHCFQKQCSPDYFCKNIEMKNMEKPKILQLNYENLDKDQYIWIVYELKKN